MRKISERFRWLDEIYEELFSFSSYTVPARWIGWLKKCFASNPRMYVGLYNAFTESRTTVSILKPPSSRLAGISRFDAFLKRFNVAHIYRCRDLFVKYPI